MTQPTSERLYGLLPSVYRRRDADQGQPLRALLAVLEEQLDLVQGDIQQLYANWFIETCAEWVVPYIGDALGVQLANPVAGEGLTLRAYIANTVGLRRRKGTAGTLERVAQDVSGWPAAAVEYFQRLATTQHMDHVRPTALGTANVRDRVSLELLGGPFENAPYTADVRSIALRRGRYNIANVGIFLWTLRALKAEQVMATVAADATSTPGSGVAFFRVSPLGQDQALWNPRNTSASLDVRQSEAQVPAPLRRVPLFQRFNALRAFETQSPGVVSPDFAALAALFQITLNGVAVPPDRVAVCNLSTWHQPSAVSPPNGILLAIDPTSGRIALPATSAAPTSLLVTYFYGAPAEIGGGSYARAPTDDGLQNAIVTPVSGTPQAPVAAGVGLTALSSAIKAWMTANPVVSPPQAAPTPQVFEIEDSLTYALRDITIPDNTHVQIRASRTGPERPLLVEPASSPPGAVWNVTLRPGAQLTLEGLWIGATLNVIASDSSQLTIVHSTIVPGVALSPTGQPRFPGTPSVQVVGNPNLQIVVKNSILGPLLASSVTGTVDVEDSVVDGGAPVGSSGPLALQAAQLSIARSTVLGAATAGALTSADESIFTYPLAVQRTQQGCVRFCYLPPGSATPRQFRCQPQLALASPGTATSAAVLARVIPVFLSQSYGTPDYARLAPACPVEIANGGEGSSEMGAFQTLQIPKRTGNLQAALSEYLRFGLEAGTFLAVR